MTGEGEKGKENNFSPLSRRISNIIITAVALWQYLFYDSFLTMIPDGRLQCQSQIIKKIVHGRKGMLKGRLVTHILRTWM